MNQDTISGDYSQQQQQYQSSILSNSLTSLYQKRITNEQYDSWQERSMLILLTIVNCILFSKIVRNINNISIWKRVYNAQIGNSTYKRMNVMIFVNVICKKNIMNI